MDGRLCAALLIFSICQSGFANKQECPELSGVQNYYGRCLKRMGTETYSNAETLCRELPGTWRLPSIDDLVNTGFDQSWLKSPPGGDCFTSASTREGNSAKVDCSSSNDVVCIHISGDVISRGETQQDTHLKMDLIPRDRNNFQYFDDLFHSTMMKKRKKRQALNNNGKRILTEAQRSKINGVSLAKIRKQPFQSRSRTLGRRLESTRRVTLTRKKIDNVPEDRDVPVGQRNPPAQGPAAGESPVQGGQTTPDKENKRIPGRNRNLFGGDKNRGAPDKTKVGREMCMGSPGWNRIEDSCVYVSNDTLTWEEAEATCEGFSYHESQATLVNMKKGGMMKHVLRLLKRMAAKAREPIGSFWVSENSLQEAETDAGPLNVPEIPVSSADGNCVAYMGTDGLKVDSCSQTHRYVCQMKAPIITEDDLVR